MSRQLCWIGFVLASVTVAVVERPAHAGMAGQIVLDQQPTQYGGPASDSQYFLQGIPRAQYLAEDMLFSDAHQIGAIHWWGFYHEDNPPAVETFRIRFYGARLTDGLPGDVLWERVLSNAVRITTGRPILLGVHPREFRYEWTMPAPFTVQAATPYWLEISQVGEPASLFRWEDGWTGNNRYAYFNPAIAPDWRISLEVANRSLQLYEIPEPAVAVLLLLATALRRRSLKWV